MHVCVYYMYTCMAIASILQHISLFILPTNTPLSLPLPSLLPSLPPSLPPSPPLLPSLLPRPSLPSSLPPSPPLLPSLLSAEKKTAVGVVQGNIDEAGELVSTEIVIVASTLEFLPPHLLTSSPPSPSPSSLLTPHLLTPHLLTSSLPHSPPLSPLTAGADGRGDP